MKLNTASYTGLYVKKQQLFKTIYFRARIKGRDAFKLRFEQF